MTNLDQAAVDRLTAKDVLDGLRADLAAPAADELQLLLKISRDLADLDDKRLVADDAIAWTARGDTRREKSRAALGLQAGFKRGLVVGFLAGFVLTALFAALLAMHWLVVMQ
ncbi:MAG TPA: hypothetical protein VGC77_08810 [Rhodopseudomonas sp.]|uniref:hypothetical protein n=1 Tax=Rhodopseudomonas sp. TaxID=1078 RepID=UPI002EDAA0B3